MQLFALWTWEAAAALAGLGLLTGWLVLPVALSGGHQHNRGQLAMAALLMLALPSLFFGFLSVLRLASGLQAPSTSWAQWLIFATGTIAGMYLEARRHG